MKRTHFVRVALACGLLASGAPLFAQIAPAPAAPNWFSGNASLLLLGHEDVGSSKFQEYRELAEGVNMPLFSIQASRDGRDFGLFARNVARSDQRYDGYATLGTVGVRFDYNQVPHDMGNDGRVFYTESSAGVWTMNAALRKALGDAVDAVPAAARTYPFYSSLLAPTLSSAGGMNVDSLRKRGDVAVDLPYGLAVTYLHEIKSGYRGASGGDILGVVTSAVDVPEPLNEVTQDFGIRWARAFKAGNAYASLNRNVYDDRVDALVIDNPFRATDLAYTSTAVPGGPAQARFSTSPDNEATRGAFGVQYKLARRTRISGDVAIGTWTQDAAFLPFTINSAIATPAGLPATDLSALPRRSLDGKINTTTFNVNFVSRPIDPLSIRVRYRSYDLENKTTPISWLGGSTSGSPDRSWTSTSASEEAPYGYATANLYNNTTRRFATEVGYDIRDLTVEASFKHAALERTSREATSGDENGYGLAAVYRGSEWLGLRAAYERLDRSAKGWDPATSIGLQADEAERERTRTGVDVELTPLPRVGLTFSYFRWNDDYPDRPTRVAGNADTTVGLLGAKYDTYTVELDYAAGERAELSAFYTYEKNAQTNRWVTLTSGAMNNSLLYDDRDTGDTFGANVLLQIVPEKWTFSLTVRHQEVDGFTDVTANAGGSFSAARVALDPPGAQDLTNLDDTKLTTLVTELGYTIAKAWTLSAGYAYDKYVFSDAYTSAATMFPQSVLFFMTPEDGGYKASLAYTRLSYRF
jgi:hypothetical protein